MVGQVPSAVGWHRRYQLPTVALLVLLASGSPVTEANHDNPGDPFCGDGVYDPAEQTPGLSRYCPIDNAVFRGCTNSQGSWPEGGPCLTPIREPGFCHFGFCQPFLQDFQNLRPATVAADRTQYTVGEPITVTAYDPGFFNNTRITGRAFLRRLNPDGSRVYLVKFCGGACDPNHWFASGGHEQWDGLVNRHPGTLDAISPTVSDRRMYGGSPVTIFYPPDFLFRSTFTINEPGTYFVELVDIFGTRVLSADFRVDPVATRAQRCQVDKRWHPATPIRITRAVDHYPKARAELDTMIPGSRIAFSLLAEDFDRLEHICVDGCDSGRRANRLTRPIADQVRYSWTHRGAGRLQSTSGSAVFFQLPDTVPAAGATATLTYGLDNPAGKAADQRVSGTVTIAVRRGAVDGDLAVTVTPNAPNAPAAAAAVPSTTAPDCQPLQESWTVGAAITGNLTVPTTVCPGAAFILEARFTDSDRLRLDCDGSPCQDGRDESDVPDVVRVGWSDGGAGGSFPLGSSGARVVYVAPPATGNITFTATATDSTTQHTDNLPAQRRAVASTRRFDLEAINAGGTDQSRNITVGSAYTWTPAWSPARQRVKRIRWQSDLGGPTGAIDKARSEANGMAPGAAALELSTGANETGLQASWRRRSHTHGPKSLRVTAWAEACGAGCICRDDAWSDSDFLDGPASNRYRLFFAKFGTQDDGKIESLATVNAADSWGAATTLRGVPSVRNWFLHWSTRSYGAANYDDSLAGPEVRYRRRSPWLGRYQPNYTPPRIQLADAGARKSRRPPFRGARRPRRSWFTTSNDQSFDRHRARQRGYSLVGHQLISKVFLHEMGHYRSITANWATGGRWQAAYGNRSTQDSRIRRDRLPASNRIRTTLTAVGNFNGRRQHLVDVRQKYDVRVELLDAAGQNVTATYNLAGAWVESGAIRTQGGATRIVGNFTIANPTRRWRFRGLDFTRFDRANDADNDFVPNQIEDAIGTAWNSDRTYPKHARGSKKEDGSQLPDQEYYADHVVIGLDTPGFGLSDPQWRARIKPGSAANDWANPGAQSNPPAREDP